MEGYDPASYGERIAWLYDELYGSMDPGPAVELLAELAGEGPVLELGIGTGRIGLPLRRRGVEVHGVDASAAMVKRLRAKPGGAEIPVTMGDFGEVPVEGRYALVFVAFNTFFALLDQDQQVGCFRRVAEHLEAGGRFVLECFVPDPCRFDRGQRVDATVVELDRVLVDISRHDPSTQMVRSQHLVVTEEGISLMPVAIRYAWPAELDLMARLAGLHLEQRWGGWDQAPFGPESTRHISVYQA